MAHSSSSFQFLQHPENRYYPSPDQTQNIQNIWPSEIQYKLVNTDFQRSLAATKISASYPTNFMNPQYQYPLADYEYSVPKTIGTIESSSSIHYDHPRCSPAEFSNAIDEAFIPQPELSVNDMKCLSLSRTSSHDPINDSIDSFEYYIKEVDTNFGRLFLCQGMGCSHETSRRIDAKRHYREKHVNIKPFVCKDNFELLKTFGKGFVAGCKLVPGGCLRRFARKEHLKNHLRCLTIEQKRSRRELRKMVSTNSRLGAY